MSFKKSEQNTDTESEIDYLKRQLAYRDTEIAELKSELDQCRIKIEEYRAGKGER